MACVIPSLVRFCECLVFFLNEFIEGKANTTLGNGFQVLMTRCVNRYVTCDLFVLGFSNCTLCPLNRLNLVGRKIKDISSP